MLNNFEPTISETKPSFLIVDDHEVVREGIKLVINDSFNGATIDVARDGSEARQLLKNQPYSMVILDIRLPHTNSFDLLEYIVNIHSKTKVLIFSMSSEGIYGKRAITAGAHGYLSKESSLQELKKAIFTILENKSYISGQLLDNLLNEVVQKNIINPFNSLSRREFEITTLLLSGLSITEIAEKVHLQTSTIGTYKSRIFDKLGVSNLIHLKELAAVYNFY